MGKNVLVVGAGPAGLAAAEAAAAAGATVTLAGREPYPPYWRPRLTHFLSEPVPAETLAMRKPEWYAGRGISLVTGRAAAHVDTAGKTVRWADGSAPTGYDALVLAAGAEPNMPQIAVAEHGLALRTYDDAVILRDAALKAGRAVIVGGGLLGLETAWELNAAGVASTLAERNRWLMPKQLDREGGQYLERKLEARGISFVIGRDPSELGELYRGACVAVAAGVRADLGFLEGSGVGTNRGVIVDGSMRTNLPAVYACGDIAEYMGRCWGLMGVAQEQGKVAGANAAGGNAAYVETPPSPILKAGDVSVFSVGNLSEGGGALALREENEAGYKCLMLKDGALAGAALIGDTRMGMKLKKAVAEKRSFGNMTDIEEILAML